MSEPMKRCGRSHPHPRHQWINGRTAELCPGVTGTLLEIKGKFPDITRTAEQSHLVALAERDALTAERDTLATWKAEALPLLDQWAKVWAALGKPGRLGDSLAAASLDQVDALTARVEALAAWRARATDLLGFFTDDPDDCRLDHNGDCQTHLGGNPCTWAEARTFLNGGDQ